MLRSSLALIQNLAARVLTKTRGRDHISPVLKSLHCLPDNCMNVVHTIDTIHFTFVSF